MINLALELVVNSLLYQISFCIVTITIMFIPSNSIVNPIQDELMKYFDIGGANLGEANHEAKTILGNMCAQSHKTR